MAGSRIKGITVEIGGDTTGLDKALKGVNSSLSKTQASLKDVNRLLKLDPANTELIAQKQKYLKDAISETKEKLDTLKEADVQAKQQLESGELGQDKYDALQREIIDTEEKLKSLEDEAKKMPTALGASLQEAGKKISDVGDKITNVGTGLSTHVTAPIAALGAASADAFQQVDSGMDIVVQKTGASGEALDAMQQSVKNLATQIPTDFETAGAAVGEVNTRFGLTGQALEDLSGQFIKFASLNNTDVSTSIDNTQKVLEAFGMSTSEASSLLDAMNKTGQNTGISMDTLANDLIANSQQMKDMGYNAYQASAFLGEVETSGADVSTVLAGLKKAEQNAASEGKTLSQALTEFSGVMNSNASDTDKLQAAYDLFGKKAGASIYDAMKTGSLSFTDLEVSASDSLGSVSDTFTGTLDPIDQFQTTMNQVKITGADIGNSLSAVLLPVLQKLSSFLQDLNARWNALSPGMQDAIVKAALITAAIGPLLVGVGKVVSAVGTITSGLGGLINLITGTAAATTAAGAAAGASAAGTTAAGTAAGGASAGFGALSASLLPIIGIAALVVAAIVAIVEIIRHWGEITEWFKGVWDTVCQGVETAIQTVSSVMTTVWTSIQTTITNAMNAIASVMSGIWNAIVSTVTTVWDTIKNVIQMAILLIREILTAAFNLLTLPWRFIWENFGDEITAAWEKIKSIISAALTAIKDTISAVWNAIKAVMEPILNAIRSAVTAAWNGISSVTATVMNAVKTAITTVWNAIGQVVSTVVSGIKTAVSTAWNAIRGVTSSVMNGVKSVITSVWNAIKGTVTNTVNAIKNTVTSVFGAIKSTATSVWNGIKTAITTPINAAKDAVKNAIDRMRSFFHFSWSLPSLKLPHVSISGHFSLNPPSVPHFGISWYKKAMDGGMILDSPTIFGAMNGKLLAGGEAGSETVVGTRSLMDMIQSAVQKASQAVQNISYGGITINVYGAPGQDIHALADLIEERIHADVMKKEAIFA
jgi:phage-related minor tail protein